MIGPHPPVHPGEILREEFMAPLKLSGYALAVACHVPRTRIERLARDARYFPKPARSLFQEIRYYFPITEQARVYYTIERYIGLAQEFIQDEIERHGEGVVAPCRATTRKGKPCQRTPLPGREYCPSHSHLEEVALSA